MISFALAAWLLVAPAAAAPVPSDSATEPGALHGRVLRMLDRSKTPPREADWAPLGPAALGELLALAKDPQAPAAQRTRAIPALPVVAHAEAAQHLAELLHTPTLPPSLRATAVLALQRRAGLAALPVLAPLLEDGDALVRSTTARALGRMGGGEARRVLEERLALEEHAEVRDALQQGLSDVEP